MLMMNLLFIFSKWVYRELFAALVNDGHDNDEHNKQDEHTSRRQQNHVKDIQVFAVLVYVDEQEQADEIERNHVYVLLSVSFGREIYEKRPPER